MKFSLNLSEKNVVLLILFLSWWRLLGGRSREALRLYNVIFADWLKVLFLEYMKPIICSTIDFSMFWAFQNSKFYLFLFLHNNFFYVERTIYSPKGSVIAPPMVSIWRSSILFVVGEQNFCFQKLEIYLLFLKPWHFLFPEGKWKSILDGVHWIWVCGW